MGALTRLHPQLSEWFADDRGRSLRATWHPDQGMVVMSLWRATECVGTIRLTPADAARLAGALAAAVQSWALDPDGPASNPDPAPPE